MKMTPKRVFTLLLVLILQLSLYACAQTAQTNPYESKTSMDKVEIPTKTTETKKQPEKTTGETREETTGETREETTEETAEETTEETAEETTEETTVRSIISNRTSRDKIMETQPMQYEFSKEAEVSLGWLRDNIDFSMTMFGAAYLGYVDGLFEEEFEEDSSGWLWTNSEAMLLAYPFIAELDKNHIIGNAGFLYCIVPVDENATVTINRVQWNQRTKTDEITEILYRSESGEPVLLFANLDGVAYEADTQVLITDNNGNTCEWYPSFDAMSYLAPCLSEAGDSLLYDFTEYTHDVPSEHGEWLEDG